VKKLLLTLLLLGAPLRSGAAPAAAADAAVPGPPTQVAAACTLAPGGLAAISFIWDAPEELTSFAWKIPVASCAACASTGLVIPRAVTMRMRWLKACSAQAEVSIVGSTQGANCLVPDPSQVLCGPVTQTISGTGNATAFHVINFPNECCLPANAFVLIRFTGLGQCGSGGTNPGLAASTAACAPCTQFVTAANIFPTMSEWCTEVGATNATWLSLSVDCCSVVPAAEHSWGWIRTLYR
jgi:hypothetical protein